MANGGIRTFFQVILDKATARRTEQETQESLKRGTDPKAAKKNAGTVQQGMAAIGQAARRLVPLLAAAFSVRSLVRFGGEVEEARRRLVRMTGAAGAGLKVLQADTRAVFREVPESIGEVSTVIGSLNTLLGVTGDELRTTARASLDFARINEVDVASSTELVGQLINRLGLEARDATGLMDRLTLAGQATGASVTTLAQGLLQASPALDALGFNLNQQVALMGQLERRGISAAEVTRRLTMSLGRFAEQGARNGAEAMEMLMANIRDAPNEMAAVAIATEAFGSRGAALAIDIRQGAFEIGEMTEALQRADGTMAATEEGSRTAQQEMATLFNTIKADLTPAVEFLGRALAAVVRFLRGSWNVVVRTVGNTMLGLELGFLKVREGVEALRVSWLRWTRQDTSEAERALMRTQIQVRQVRMAIGELNDTTEKAADVADDASEAFNRLRANMEDTPEAAGRLSEAVQETVAALVEGHQLRTLTGQEMFRALELERQIKAALAEGNLELAERNALTRQLNAMQPLTAQVGLQLGPLAGVDSAMGGLRDVAPGRIPMDDQLQRQQEFADLYAEQWKDTNRELVNAAQTAAMGVSNAWADAFGIMFTQGAAVGQFFDTLFRGVAAAGLGALSQYASEQVAINVAEAITMFARSLGLSFLNPGAAVAAQASAKQHLVAAAAWGAIGGASAAGQTAIGGGGGAAMSGGLPSGATDPFARQQQVLGELVIQLDGFDPGNPRHQESLAEAQLKAAERGLTIRMEGR